MFLLIIGIIGKIPVPTRSVVSGEPTVGISSASKMPCRTLFHNTEINKVIILGKWGFGGRFHFHYSAKDFPMITGNLSQVDDIYRRF